METMLTATALSPARPSRAPLVVIAVFNFLFGALGAFFVFGLYDDATHTVDHHGERFARPFWGNDSTVMYVAMIVTGAVIVALLVGSAVGYLTRWRRAWWLALGATVCLIAAQIAIACGIASSLELGTYLVLTRGFPVVTVYALVALVGGRAVMRR
jgi:hypothetical protein